MIPVAVQYAVAGLALLACVDIGRRVARVDGLDPDIHREMQEIVAYALAMGAGVIVARWILSSTLAQVVAGVVVGYVVVGIAYRHSEQLVYFDTELEQLMCVWLSFALVTLLLPGLGIVRWALVAVGSAGCLELGAQRAKIANP